MIIDIILGNNVDTNRWIYDLRVAGAENIVVIDYEHTIEFEEIEDICYMSPIYASKYLEQFDTKNYYKSMYVFPGMNGIMSSLQRKNNKKY